MIHSKCSILKELEQLQVNGCMTDTCLVGASDKVFIHRAMLFLADHVQPHPVWHQLDPGEGDGKVVVIVPDASNADLEAFVRKLCLSIQIADHFSVHFMALNRKYSD